MQRHAADDVEHRRRVAIGEFVVAIHGRHAIAFVGPEIDARVGEPVEIIETPLQRQESFFPMVREPVDWSQATRCLCFGH